MYPEFRSQNSGVSMRTPAKTFEDLIVWQESHQFVLDIYGLTNELPKSEAFGLISQIRRAAISISANISEGFKLLLPFWLLNSDCWIPVWSNPSYLVPSATKSFQSKESIPDVPRAMNLWRWSFHGSKNWNLDPEGPSSNAMKLSFLFPQFIGTSVLGKGIRLCFIPLWWPQNSGSRKSTLKMRRRILPGLLRTAGPSQAWSMPFPWGSKK